MVVYLKLKLCKIYFLHNLMCLPEDINMLKLETLLNLFSGL